MNPEVVITCAVAGAGDTVGKHPDIPVTPAQIAASALDAARAGAAIDDPPLFQLCFGIPWAAPADVGVSKACVDVLPPGSNWTAFAISRNQMPFAAQSVLLAGHVRVGLEANLYLKRGVYATNSPTT